PETWRELRRAGCPIVVIGQVSDPELTSVAHDVPGIVGSILRHLTDRGDRRIGVLASPRNTRYHQLLRTAWDRAAEAAGVDLSGWWAETNDRREAAAIVSAWLRAERAPTAIVCHDHRSGIGVSAAARGAGLTIGVDFDLFLMTTEGADWCWEPGTW